MNVGIMFIDLSNCFLGRMSMSDSLQLVRYSFCHRERHDVIRVPVLQVVESEGGVDPGYRPTPCDVT
jgi:hypothetical protein